MISRIVRPLAITVLLLPARARSALGKDTVTFGVVIEESMVVILHLSFQAVYVIASIISKIAWIPVSVYGTGGKAFLFWWRGMGGSPCLCSSVPLWRPTSSGMPPRSGVDTP